jgi:hypothetical protein
VADTKVNISVTAKGTKQAGAEIDNVNNKINRLTGEVGGASKAFSKQASGLGGLVGAYAGAAATVFALQQAFSALNRAAVAEQTIQGTIALGSAIGESGKLILENVREITKAQLTLVEAAENVNIALSAGFNTSQIEKLTNISFKASRALGRNLTDAFQRVVRGSSKLEPELLDELGIFTRIEPAVQKYASALGKNATALTNFEKRQAFVNAVIEEGERKFSTISTTSETAAESLERFQATIGQLALDAGSFVANFLAPVANFISGNFSNALSVTGVAAMLVFNKGLQLLGGSITDFADKKIANANTRLEAFVTNSPKAAAALDNVNKSVTAINASFLKGETRKETAALKELGVQGKLAATDLERLKTISTEQISLSKEKIIELEKDVVNQKKSQEARDKATRSLKNQRIELRQQEAVLKKTQVAISSIDKAALRANKTSLLFAKGLNFVAKGATRVINAFVKLSIIISIVTLAANLLIDAFDLRFTADTWVRSIVEMTKALFGFDEASKNLKESLAGISSGLVSSNLKEVAGALKDFDNLTFLKKGGGLFGGDIFVSREIKDFEAELSNALDELIKRRKLLIEAQNKERTSEAVQQRMINNRTMLVREQEAAIRKLGTSLTGMSAESIIALKAFNKAAVQALDVSKFAQEFAFLSATVGKSVSDLVSKVQFTGEGGVTSGLDSVFTFVDPVQVTTIEKIKKEVNELVKLGTINEAQRQRELASRIKIAEGAHKLLGAQVLGVELQELLNKGLISAEGISSRIIAIETLITAARKSGNEEIADQLEHVIAMFEVLKNTANLHIEIETITKQVRKTFSSQISAADKLTGIISLNGKLATTELEKKTIQLALLRESVDAGKDALARQRKGITLTDEEVKLAELALSAEKAIAGFIFQSVVELKKLNEELTKRLQKEKAFADINDRQQTIKLLQLEIKLEAEKQKGKEKELQTAQKLLDIERKLLDLRNIKIPATEKARTDQQTLEALEAQLANAAGPLSFLFSDTDRMRLEIAIEKQSLAILVTSIENQIAAIELQGVRQKADLALEIQNINKQIAFNKEQAVREDKLAKARTEEELIKARVIEESKQLEITKIKEQATFLLTQSQLLNNHVSGLDQILANHLAGLNIGLGKTDLTKKEGESASGFRQRVAGGIKVNVSDELTKQITDQANQANKLAEKLASDTAQNHTKELLNIRKRAEEQNKLRTATRQNTEAELKGKRQIAANTRALVDEEVALQVAIKEEEIRQAEEDARLRNDIRRKENDTFLSLARNLSDRLGETFSTSIKELTVDVVNGTKTMKDAFRDLINNIIISIQEAVTEELITKPFKELISGGLKGLSSDSDSGFSFGGLISKLFGSGYSISSAASSAASSADFSDFAGGFTPFDLSGLAAGGLVRNFAAGGPNRGVRDSVPALLEPGEFVLRKQAVKNMGMATASRLNGGLGSTLAPVVNITNEGTAQEPAETPKIAFDGEKMVVDIVLRDLSNNGPMRQKLKGLRG